MDAGGGFHGMQFFMRPCTKLCSVNVQPGLQRSQGCRGNHRAAVVLSPCMSPHRPVQVPDATKEPGTIAVVHKVQSCVVAHG